MTLRLASWLAASALVLTMAAPARAQELDMSQGGPVTVTAQDGIDWDQNAHEVIAHGSARAVRGTVTVDADRLIAYYRKKTAPAGSAATAKAAPPPAPTGAPPTGATPGTAAPGAAAPGGAAPAADQDSGGTEIYRLAAEGNVRIYTQTDQAQGDRAVYDMDQAVLVLTGHDLKLTTPNEVLTAKDALEYWPQQHMAVARGDAVVVTKDARRMAADTLVAYTLPGQQQPASGGATQVAAKTPETAKPDTTRPDDDATAMSGKLKKVEAFGHVSVRTVTDTVTGDRAVYVPETEIARIIGNVRITRGDNQMNGQEAEVNQKTGISRLLSGPDERVQGLVVPNDANTSPASPGAGGQPKPGQPKPAQPKSAQSKPGPPQANP